MGRAAIQGWISLDAATKLFKLAGLDYRQLKAAGGDARLQARAARLTASMSFKQTHAHGRVAERHREDHAAAIRRSRTSTSSTPRTGITSARRRRSTATRSTTARATTRAAPRCSSRSRARSRRCSRAPKRSILFLRVTAEEQGLLGSEYYATFPLYPLDKTLANINIDETQRVGPHEGPHGDRPRRVRPRRLRARRGRRAGPHAHVPTRSRRRVSTTAPTTSTSRRSACRRSIRTPASTSSASRRATARRSATSGRRSSTTSRPIR